MSPIGKPVVGVGGGVLAGTGATVVAQKLPATGAETTVQIAIAVATALLVWAIVYMAWSRKTLKS